MEKPLRGDNWKYMYFKLKFLIPYATDFNQIVPMFLSALNQNS